MTHDSLYCRRDVVALCALLALAGYSLAAGRSYFDNLVPESIRAGAPRQLARELVGCDLLSLSADDRLRVDQFLTSLSGEGVGSCGEGGALDALWLKPCVRGRTRWLLAQCCNAQVRLHQFDSDWKPVAITYIDRSSTRFLWCPLDVEFLSAPLSPVVVVKASVTGIGPSTDLVRRACFGLDDGGAFVLRYEDEAGHLAKDGRGWAATWNDREGFTPASWLQALSSEEPQEVLSALSRFPGTWPGDDAEAATAWRRVAEAAEPMLSQLAESQCAWIREAAVQLHEERR